MNLAEREALAAQMLEMLYDLLPSEEAVSLRRRIAAEPEVAALFHEIERQQRVLAEAARLEVPRIPLPAPESPMIASATSRSSNASGSSRLAAWLLGTAAAALVGLTAGGYLYHRHEQATAEDQFLRVVLTGPSRLQKGAENRFTVTTTSLADEPRSQKITWALYSPANETLRREEATTDEAGQFEIRLPADLAVPGGSRLRVAAVYANELQEYETRLAVEPEHFDSYLSLDKPLYQPGETVFYRSLTLRRAGLAADREFEVEFKLLDPSGAVVAGSELAGRTERGVGNGAFRLPDELPGGEYTLLLLSQDGMFREQARKFFVRRYRLPRIKKELEFVRDSYGPGDRVAADFSAVRAEGGPVAAGKLTVFTTLDGQSQKIGQFLTAADGSFRIEFPLPEAIEQGGQLVVVVDDGANQETMAKTIPIQLGKIQVDFYPEGGDLAAGLESTVYFHARDPLGKPADVRGRVLDSKGAVVVEAATTHEGRGLFRLTPKAGETYRLAVDAPTGIKDEPPLPDPQDKALLTLTSRQQVFAADAPLELTVTARKAGLPLVAVAVCRGVQVAQRPFVSRNGPQNVTLTPPEQLAGVYRVTVFDYSGPAPRAVAERLVYRRGAQRLSVQVGAASEAYAPGEKARLTLHVQNERGLPTPAALGLAVTDDTLLNLADDKHPSLTTHFWLTTEIDRPEDLEDAEFFLRDDAEAAPALDLLLGTQGWRRFVEADHEALTAAADPRIGQENVMRLVDLSGAAAAPMMFDNLPQIRPAYQERLATRGPRWTQAIGGAAILGGVLLALLVVLLALFQFFAGLRVWMPVLVVAALAAGTGGWLYRAASPTGRADALVAYREFKVEPPAEAFWGVGGMGGLGGGGGFGMADAAVAAEALPMVEAGADPAQVPAPVAPTGAAPDDQRADALNDLRLAEAVGPAPLLKLIDAQEPEPRPAAEGKPQPPQGDANKEMDDAISSRFQVRQYAHRHAAGVPGVRSDFTETVYWHPLLITDDQGRAEIAFDLSDAVTAYRVRVEAHGGGRLGTSSAEIVSRLPFHLEPKLPLEVTAGDRIDLPVAILNETRGTLPVKLKLVHGESLVAAGTTLRELSLSAGGRGREFFTLDVQGTGPTPVRVEALAGPLGDAVERTLRIVPGGFPVRRSYSGQLQGRERISLRLPEKYVPGSLELSVQVYPSTLAELQQGIDNILQEPYGCFEQASSSTYPNILALQYLEEHRVASPETTRRARDLLAKGYKLLSGYECQKQGYEWFGSDPGHEALSAYGLLEFRDMAKVYAVDAAMIDRTAAWLRSRRDGQGGYQRNPQALDSFGSAPPEITNAYITWALTESGEKDLAEEWKYVESLGEKSDDPYLLALAGASLINSGNEATGRRFLDKLAAAQQADGHLDGKQTSITASGGQSLAIETTSLAALAWNKLPAYQVQARRAVEWLARQRSAGGFGSTQATILALKAMVAHARANRRTVAPGELIVRRGEQEVGRQAFPAGADRTISVGGVAATLQPGENELTLELEGENQMPYAVDLAYRSDQPASEERCPVRLTTALGAAQVAAGQTAPLTAKLVNATDQGQPMTVAILGLPAGLEPQTSQLDDLKKAGTIDYYELKAREIVLYWRGLAPKREIDVRLDLTAAIPGKYTGPASRAYLYYTAEAKHWIDPLRIEIARE